MEVLRDPAMQTDPTTATQLPMAQRLTYGSSFHQQLVGRIRARLQLSQRHISQRYDDWDRANEHVDLYLDLTRRARKGDRTLDTTKKEMPVERSVVVPMAYAVLQVRLTAMVALFTARDPMIQIEGRGPEDVQAAKMIEALIAYDLQKMGGQMMLYGFLKNAEKYGLGILADSWHRDMGWADQPPDPRQAFMMMSMGLPPPQPQRAWKITQEYFRADVVDPYEFRPDPRVPGAHVNDMEFIGHRVRKAYTYLLAMSQENGGPYFNIRHLRRAMDQRRQQPGRSRETDLTSSSLDLRETADDADRGVYVLEHLQVRLVPREWQLSEETRPEIWQFVLAGDTVIIQAERRTNAHDKFGYSVAQTHYDPHATFQPGMVENMDGIQRLSNWLYNSHIDNVRKTINDALVYGPSFIEENDLLNPGPGRHVRLTRLGEEMVQQGRMTIQQMFQQLVTVDVTRGHLQEVQQLYDMVQRMTGVNDPAMGQPTDTKRTLGEIERILVSSSRRLAMQAQLYDAQAVQPLAERMIADRQQYTSMEQYIRITGRLAQELKQEHLLTNRRDIQGSFDYIPVSGTMPPDPERTATVWVQLMTMLARAPQLMQPGPDGRALNLRWFLQQVSQAMGIKDIEDAFIQVMPQAQLQGMVQAGNAIPMGGAPPQGRIPGAGIQGPMVPGGIPGGMAVNGV